MHAEKRLRVIIVFEMIKKNSFYTSNVTVGFDTPLFSYYLPAFYTKRFPTLGPQTVTRPLNVCYWDARKLYDSTQIALQLNIVGYFCAASFLTIPCHAPTTIYILLFIIYLYKKCVCKISENSTQNYHRNFPKPKFTSSKFPILSNKQFKPQNIQFIIRKDKEKQQIITFEKLEPVNDCLFCVRKCLTRLTDYQNRVFAVIVCQLIYQVIYLSFPPYPSIDR